VHLEMSHNHFHKQQKTSNAVWQMKSVQPTPSPQISLQTPSLLTPPLETPSLQTPSLQILSPHTPLQTAIQPQVVTHHNTDNKKRKTDTNDDNIQRDITENKQANIKGFKLTNSKDNNKQANIKDNNNNKHTNTNNNNKEKPRKHCNCVEWKGNTKHPFSLNSIEDELVVRDCLKDCVPIAIIPIIHKPVR
jgi:hypothetical protein